MKRTAKLRVVTAAEAQEFVEMVQVMTKANRKLLRSTLLSLGLTAVTFFGVVAFILFMASR